MAGKSYRLSSGASVVLGLSPVVFMFLWDWRVGLGWVVLFLFSMRESVDD